MCVGYKFAQLEHRLVLATLLQHYSFHLAPGSKPPRMFSGVVYSPDAVWLTIKPRAAPT
jgi:cytochrome P450